LEGEGVCPLSVRPLVLEKVTVKAKKGKPS
jgi:hypothetical protein